MQFTDVPVSVRIPYFRMVDMIVRHLRNTKKEGITLDPDDDSFKVYVDSDFCGKWDRLTAENGPSTSNSRFGHMITCTGYPVLWNSKLKIHVALSTTESEHVTLS